MEYFKGIASEVYQKNTIMPITIESKEYNDEYNGKNDSKYNEGLINKMKNYFK